MTDKDYTRTFLVDLTSADVFARINNVSHWWTENMEGSSEQLNDEFAVRFGDVHFSRQRVVEIVPGRRIVWLVNESRLNFIKHQDEWTDTKIIFEIRARDGKTEIKFTHEGLKPSVECYSACKKGWDFFVNESLFKYLTEGKGCPDSRVLPDLVK